jgi:hypothetical protein
MKREELKAELLEKIKVNFNKIKEIYIEDILDEFESDDDSINEMNEVLKNLNNAIELLDHYMMTSFGEKFDDLEDFDIEFFNERKYLTIFY